MHDPSPSKLCINLPSGDTRPLPVPVERFAGQQLDEWLREHGIALNTRCGGRGACRGCRVWNESATPPRPLRACQTPVHDWPADLCHLRIPQNSLQDGSLNGLSLFELRTSLTPVARAGTGLAIDLGTTTVAACLWNLNSGQCLATASLANAQRAMGDNVVTRIAYAAARPHGLREMQQILLDQTLRPLLTTLIEQSATSWQDLREASVAGNPVMLHILAGAPLTGFERYPFQPVFLEARTLDAAQLGFPTSCPINLLPSFGPFVGADIVAGALAAGFHHAAPPLLLIDLGTNGEILLKTDTGYLCTATAVGPAFEGGRLNHGATARNGVIASLAFDGTHWTPTLVDPPNGSPIGISGAAYIDFLALGRAHGLILPNGRFAAGHPAVRPAPEDPAEKCVYVSAQLFISEADIAELLQAKAAIAAGLATLLESAAIEPTQLPGIYLAGGFGFYLNSAHAMAIGMLPDLPPERIECLGNSALAGASLHLQNAPACPIQQLIENTSYLELNSHPSFEDHFTDNLFAQPME